MHWIIWVLIQVDIILLQLITSIFCFINRQLCHVLLTFHSQFCAVQSEWEVFTFSNPLCLSGTKLEPESQWPTCSRDWQLNPPMSVHITYRGNIVQPMTVRICPSVRKWNTSSNNSWVSLEQFMSFFGIQTIKKCVVISWHIAAQRDYIITFIMWWMKQRIQ